MYASRPVRHQPPVQANEGGDARSLRKLIPTSYPNYWWGECGKLLQLKWPEAERRNTGFCFSGIIKHQASPNECVIVLGWVLEAPKHTLLFGKQRAIRKNACVRVC